MTAEETINADLGEEPAADFAPTKPAKQAAKQETAKPSKKPVRF